MTKKFHKTTIIIIFLFAVALVPFTKTLIERRMAEAYYEKYPGHPTLSDCENLTDVDKDLCLSDVAEIANDINQCNKINDKAIQNFCIAKITLNPAMCQDLSTELKANCLESIAMKKEWLGIS